MNSNSWKATSPAAAIQAPRMRAPQMHRGKNMSDRPMARSHALTFLLLAFLFLPLAARAQDESSETKGVNSGDYNIQQTIEFGYRWTGIDGNLNNYYTFVNLGSGVRLLDYTLNVHSIDHQGLFFDNLSFSSFGYGGDPNDVTRLYIDKNKWYDFRGTFRRDKNFWDYNLLANPLNPSSFVTPMPIVNSPHGLDLVRRMQDYDLTLLPQSRLRFRLGYSRNVNEGPGLTTLDGGTEPVLAAALRYTSDSYRAGVDYRLAPRTTVSFDEFLTYFKQDNRVTDQNLTYMLTDGTPADLGIVFTGTSPCASPILNATTTPPTANSNCNGYLAYTLAARPRSSFPTEQFRFQSNYFKNFEMSGSASYTSADDSFSDYTEAINAWTSRTSTRGNTLAGPAKATRVTVGANWAGTYQITDKLRLNDQFWYYNWRIPGAYTSIDTNLFPVPAAPGQTGMLLPISPATVANFSTVCPSAPYKGPQCPQHASGSAADYVSEAFTRFLGQNLKTNTFELEYDLTPKVTGHVGYLYTNRTIADFAATSDVAEVYFPGGSTGTAANYYLAARADCAVVAGALPSGCTLNPDGTITEVGPEAGNDTSRNITTINEHALLVGLAARPTSQLRINADFAFGYNDNSFTRISPRQVQSYKIHATYNPKPWANLDAAIDIHENRDNVTTVNNLEHGRTYSFGATLAPSSRIFANFGYSYVDIYTQSEICFPSPGSAIFTTPCPVAGSPSPLGALAFYNSTDHYGYADVIVKPIKRVTAAVGYSGSVVRGSTLFLNSMQPTGPLDFNYLTPFAALTLDIYKGFSYKTAWNYYGYNDKGVANPAGLAALPLQDFNGSNVTFSFRYAF
jgi:hypothetical protein